MYPLIQLETIIPPVSNTISQSPLRRGFIFIALTLACFALSPAARAVTPAPDGGYPGQNTAEGTDALLSLNSGVNNTAIGFYALKSNDTGTENTASGAFALESNTNGYQNTASGVGALERNTTGSYNTATGVFALSKNTTGNENTASGFRALVNNTTGYDNTASGTNSLLTNTTGFQNTASGVSALLWNSNGSNNAAYGANALYLNSTGTYNTAIGFNALYSNSSASYNTAQGYDALFSNTTGAFNTANGVNALLNNTLGSYNAALGFNGLAGLTTGNNNVGIGLNAGANLTTGSNNIVIGAGVLGSASDAGKIRIGKSASATYISGIYGKTASSLTASAVFVDSSGHLGTVKSSARFKDEIKPMDQASETLLALQPVTFRYKEDLDPDGIPQFGLIAEQVEKVNPNLVIRDEDGKVMTVRYEAVNAMLLNEFLKEHRTVQELKKTATRQEAAIAQQKSEFQTTIERQQKEIKALTAGLREQASLIQKVSDQLEVSKPAPQMVLNNQ